MIVAEPSTSPRSMTASGARPGAGPGCARTSGRTHPVPRSARHILTPPLSLTPGTRLGPYEVVSAIGAGGMGEVYRATDTKLKRQVAIKILPRLVRSRPRTAGALPARGRSARVAEPSAHRRDLRTRRKRWRLRARDGAGRGRGPGTAHRAWRDPRRRSAALSPGRSRRRWKRRTSRASSIATSSPRISRCGRTVL